ncbi:DUF695 domain-containing protein [Sulfurimonas sp. CS5]|uniref:DUF695 domain-containing protein n=1 Tax=Sulfurimonas sp. CS5 TaxID=3391145 RepID=UPI0039E955F0
MREIFNRVEDNSEVVIEVNIEATDAKEMNPWLFSTFVKYDNLDETKEGYEEFLETKESLIIALEHQDRAVYVGTRVIDGWNEFYFYAYDSKKLDSIVSKILTPSNYVYESNVVRDTKWGFYETQLFPTELEFCHIQSAKIIFLLEEEDEDLTIQREVEHYVSFETPTQKNRFINTLDIEGFIFKDEISSEEFEHGVALVKKHAVIEKEVKKVVDELFAKVKENNGYYEGWSTTLVQGEEI